MMEEVSTITAFDAQVMEQMSEEEILACLEMRCEIQKEVDSDCSCRIFQMIPATEAKLGKSRLELMDDDEPLDRYLRENHRLQQASLRLEQENDTLAHRLISSKVALRSTLDQAEDRVDELTKDLFQTRQRLQVSEEEKRSREEEAAVSKEVFRSELEKVEHEVRRSSGVIADYKQICSQLAKHLEKQQAAHREEMEALQSLVAACSRCRGLVESGEPSAADQLSPAAPEGLGMTRPSRDEGPDRALQWRDAQQKESLRAQTRELEQELAKTKLQMVEAECKIQELQHQKGILANDLQEAKNTWISKAFASRQPPGDGAPTSTSAPRDRAPASVWSLHMRPLSGWSTKRLSWPHRDNREDA